MSFSVILFMIIGILCILYGIMVLMIRSGTTFFVVWFALGAFFLLLGFMVRNHLLEVIPRLLRGVLLVMICAGVLMLVDCLIVLGAQVREDGPSAVLKYRLDAAADYLRENSSTVCIVTGGKGPSEPFSEGQGMKDYLVRAGIPAERIIVEDRALNTVQNIQYSKALMPSPDASVAIVTNNFHVTRGLALARRQGLTNAYAIAAPSTVVYLPNNMLREFFGLSKDFLLGNL